MQDLANPGAKIKNSNFTETMHRDNNRGIKITIDRIHR